MTPEQAIEKRQQLLRDGFCVVDNILSDEFLGNCATRPSA